MKRITPRHLQLAIRGDEELDTLVRATIAGGGPCASFSRRKLFHSQRFRPGVLPFIHKSLTNPKGKKTPTEQAAQ